MRRLSLAAIISVLFVTVAFGAEPIKRQTAMEIYQILFSIPYGADIGQLYEMIGPPIYTESDFLVYQHQRTGCKLFVLKTPFNTVQNAHFFEECASLGDAQARCMLIIEQFKRRFGEPAVVKNGVTMWNIKDLAALSVFPSSDGKGVIYKLDPFPGR